MKIELLAPAKDVNIGRAAILAGADAIYIGGSRFGARVNAGNSISEIGELVEFAHIFGAKVYLTMNTILYDNELELAREQAYQAYNVGVDALIVQDMAYMEMGLPIELHASTQTFNFTPEKVGFLEDAGFARVVLERGLSLSEIKDIRRVSGVELEAFIHGAICVGYSGQCYLSQAVVGRSGNRGECAQLCRSSYDLIDDKSNVLARRESVLSVGDMCMDGRVKDLIDAGVCSLKIEGRLKNETYVVNNVAYYDGVLKRLGVDRASCGISEARFKANPQKSFLRNGGVYFFDNKKNIVGAPTKSLGEKIGVVKDVRGREVVVVGGEVLNCGDGVVWMREGDVLGGNVNGVDGDKILLWGESLPLIGDLIFRNSDVKFNVGGEDVERKIDVEIIVGEGVISVRDENGYVAQVDIVGGDVAKSVDRARMSLEGGLMKSGGTVFEVKNVIFEVENVPFLPMSVVNGIRRELLERLKDVRLRGYERRFSQNRAEKCRSVDFADGYLLNVSNELSRQFWVRNGVMVNDVALEISGDFEGKDLLRSRFCVRRERGLCPKVNKGQFKRADGNAADMYIENGGKRLRLTFDCNRCEMVVKF